MPVDAQAQQVAARPERHPHRADDRADEVSGLLQQSNPSYDATAQGHPLELCECEDHALPFSSMARMKMVSRFASPAKSGSPPAISASVPSAAFLPPTMITTR